MIFADFTVLIGTLGEKKCPIFATFGPDFVHSATTKFKYHNSSFRTARFYETQGKGLEARVMNQLKTCGYMMKQTGNTLKKFH